MCQKAVGGPFAVICPVLKKDFHVTRGDLAHFASSDIARRGFCRQCGTPMTFEYPLEPDFGVLAGTLDQAALAPPVVQYGTESRLPWYQGLDRLPGDQPTYSNNPEMLAKISGSNHQHPDNDTAQWPLAGK